MCPQDAVCMVCSTVRAAGLSMRMCSLSLGCHAAQAFRMTHAWSDACMKQGVRHRAENIIITPYSGSKELFSMVRWGGRGQDAPAGGALPAGVFQGPLRAVGERGEAHAPRHGWRAAPGQHLGRRRLLPRYALVERVMMQAIHALASWLSDSGKSQRALRAAEGCFKSHAQRCAGGAVPGQHVSCGRLLCGSCCKP